jgi:ABC-type branched-subunit amino acid transport system ATPase component
MSGLMQISEVTVDFGGVRALSDVFFSVEQQMLSIGRALMS